MDLLNTVSCMDIMELCDCIEDDLNHINNLRLYPFGALMNIHLPKSQYFITALFEIRILGLVFCYLAFLPSVRGWEFIRVAMPIIAVKLDNQIRTLNKGINTEFASDYKLRGVGNPGTVNYPIGNYLKVIRAKCLLVDIQLDKALSVIWIIVSTFNRAINSLAVDDARRGSCEILIACFANKANFISRLPFVCAFIGTKPRPFSTCWHIERFRANLTLFINSGLFREWASCCQTAFIGTIFLWAKKALVAFRAIMIFTTVRNSTFCWHNYSYHLGVIILYMSITNNPVVLYEYAGVNRQ